MKFQQKRSQAAGIKGMNKGPGRREVDKNPTPFSDGDAEALRALFEFCGKARKFVAG